MNPMSAAEVAPFPSFPHWRWNSVQRRESASSQGRNFRVLESHTCTEGEIIER
jgi:hypothetical protein